MESLDYEGGYPIARLTFHDAALPVEVRLEAFNPMIPLGYGQLVDPLRHLPPHRHATRAACPPKSRFSRRCKTRSAAAGPAASGA